MSGVAVIVAKLKAHAPLVAIVPAARIQAGDMPQGTSLPAISVTQISRYQHKTIKRASSGVMQFDTVRVSVMVHGLQTATSGTGYSGLRALLALVLAACPETRGTVAGIAVDAIEPGTEGPDLSTSDPATLSATRDFMVRWTN